MDTPDHKTDKKASFEVLMGFVITFFGSLIGLTLILSTPTYLHYGLAIALVFWIPLLLLSLPFTLVFWWTFYWMEKKKYLPIWISPTIVKRGFRILLIVLLVLVCYNCWPSVRCSQMTGIPLSSLRDVKARGFNAPQASRWCFSFNTPKSEIDAVIQEWRLTKVDSFSSNNDVFGDDFLFNPIDPAPLGISDSNYEFFQHSEQFDLTASRSVFLAFHPQSESAWFLYSFNR